jgi:hypothetical protein
VKPIAIIDYERSITDYERKIQVPTLTFGVTHRDRSRETGEVAQAPKKADAEQGAAKVEG